MFVIKINADELIQKLLTFILVNPHEKRDWWRNDLKGKLRFLNWYSSDRLFKSYKAHDLVLTITCEIEHHCDNSSNTIYRIK